jgi:antitoxin component of MazEF toxin-antitoxin module
LTEAEALQVINFMPTEPVEIHLMVEEMHTRMSEDRQRELLDLIASYRKRGTENADENAMDGKDDSEEIVGTLDVQAFPLNAIKTEL